jgi:hypothetical protein
MSCSQKREGKEKLNKAIDMMSADNVHEAVGGFGEIGSPTIIVGTPHSFISNVRFCSLHWKILK